MIQRTFLMSSVLLLLSGPAMADPSLGVGLNFTFGSGQVNTGIGVRVFSDDEEDSAALSLGLDYMFGSGALRTSVGAAYLMDNSYVEVNGGYDFGLGVFNAGVGFGFADTDDPIEPAVTAPITGDGDGDTTDGIDFLGSDLATVPFAF